jgi:pyruvate/2-oxoglutarate dehydrogenase complex dihydrolipoamide dehydrogenase (E3) component
MERSHTYDVLVVGGGQAGIPLAYKLAAEGMSVALAERKNLGGSCVNFGCTPTKAVIASARVAHQARRPPEYGLEIPEVRVDFPAVLRRAKEIVDLKRGGLEKGLEVSGFRPLRTDFDGGRLLRDGRIVPKRTARPRSAAREGHGTRYVFGSKVTQRTY